MRRLLILSLLILLKKYRYIVKLVGTFTEENQETGRTSTVTSEGVIVNVE